MVMVFSKSFGYALRGILYVAINEEKPRVKISEIAERLSVPRHFLGKVMKGLVKKGILSSTKGPYGGFSLSPATLDTPLIEVMRITEGSEVFDHCVLRLRKCNATNPCPLHTEVQEVRGHILQLFSRTTIGDLMQADKQVFINSIATI